jgi:hypothetical protein
VLIRPSLLTLAFLQSHCARRTFLQHLDTISSTFSPTDLHANTITLLLYFPSRPLQRHLLLFFNTPSLNTSTQLLQLSLQPLTYEHNNYSTLLSFTSTRSQSPYHLNFTSHLPSLNSIIFTQDNAFTATANISSKSRSRWLLLHCTFNYVFITQISYCNFSTCTQLFFDNQTI